jgi:hypothetical protein
MQPLYHKLLKYALIALFLVLPATAIGAGPNIAPLDQWRATSTPVSGITQRVLNRPLILTGLADGCLSISSFVVGSSGVPCGSGGGSGWSTTSADYWASQGYGWSTTSADHWLTLNQGDSWSTTSADYWLISTSTWSTTSANAWLNASTSQSLPGCDSGEIIEWSGTRWDCAADDTGGGGSAFGQAWEIVSGALAPTTTLGIRVAASSTIGAGGQDTGLTILGGATTTEDLIVLGSTTVRDVLNLSNPLASSTILTDVKIGAGAWGQNKLKLIASGAHPASNSVGGLFNLTNTLNSGPAIVAYTNHAGSATGPLLAYRCDNAAFDFPCERIDYDGTNDALVLVATAAASNALSASNAGVDHTINSAYTGATADKGALNLTSTNNLGSVFQIAGNPDGLGVGKITHNAVGDAGSSVLSLAATNVGYLGQGLFIDIETAAAQKILNLRGDGTEFATLMSSTGNFGLSSSTPSAKLSVHGGGLFAGPLFVGGNLTATGTITFPAITDGCVNITSGVLGSTGSSCGAGGGSDFSTTSANFWSSLGYGWSTTSANAWSALGYGWSTTSANAWSTLGYGWSTTSAEAWRKTDWQIVSGALAPTTTLGVRVSASSTIGAGTTGQGLTTFGTATTTGNAYFASRLGIATVTPSAPLSVTGNIQQWGNYVHFGTAIPEYDCKIGDTCVDVWGDDNTTGGVNFVIGNRNAGANAYTGVNLMNDNASFAFFAGLYFNSSAYSDATFGTGVNSPNQFLVQNTLGPTSIVSSTSTAPSSFINFLTGGSASGNERARITSAGGVGIGTTNPTARLSVAGSLSITGTSTITGSTTIGTGRDALTVFGNSTTTQATSTNSFASVASSTDLFTSNLTARGSFLTVSSLGNILRASTTIGMGTTGNGTTLFGTATTTLQHYFQTGFNSVASSTIGGGTLQTGLTVFGGATTTATSTLRGVNITGSNTSTSTQYIYSKTAGFGGRIILEDSDAAGCTEVWALNGVLVAATITCPPEV